MENKQTAVDFLLHEISEIIGVISPDAFSSSLMKIRYEQAKQMEKEQHDLTFARGHMTGYANANGYETKDFEQYYNETYGKANI